MGTRWEVVTFLAFLVVIVIGYLSYRNVDRLYRVNVRVAEASEMLTAVAQADAAIQSAQNSTIDFALLGDDRHRTAAAAGIAEAQGQLSRLRVLTLHDTSQKARLDQLAPQIQDVFRSLQQVMHQPGAAKSGAVDATTLLVKEGKSLDEVRGHLHAMRDEEERVLDKYSAESSADTRTTLLLVALRNVLALIVLLAVAAALHYDISRRVKAEKALSASERQYRTLFENAPVGIYRTTPDGRILAANPALVTMLGFSSLEELARRDLNTSGFEPQYARAQFMERIEKAGELAGLESPWRKKNGEVIHVRENARAIRGDSGQVLYYEGTVEDITQRKIEQAEHARLVTAIEQFEEAVVITNAAGDIEYVNPAFSRMTGYTREETLGKNPRILKSDKQNPSFYRHLWITILRGQTWQGELINRRKDGTSYTERMNIGPVRDARGEISHFIATKQDVSERKTLEAQLQQAARIEAIGRLAGGVAHDFNNLLTVINGYADLLHQRFECDKEASAYLNEIQNAGERAAGLTRQLLAFSRRQVLAPQVLDLNQVVSNLEKMLTRLIGEHIQLRTVLHPALRRVKADPGQIDQVIMNLAVNARDAMPTGGQLTIETDNVELDEAFALSHPTVKPGLHVVLAVSDTGVGMVAEIRARIFEPFFTTKEQGKGTGLGLATVYGIVKQSEGSIWVESEPGQGTVFKMFLPAVNESPALRERVKAVTDSASGTETIMVVEDEEGVLSLIRLALGAAGYKVLEAGDPEHAVAICSDYDGPVHLLLTDVVMPKMSGPKVAEKVTALRPDIKVLYMSGYTDDSIVHHGVLSEGLPFIQKPFSPLSLRKKIRAVLDSK